MKMAKIIKAANAIANKNSPTNRRTITTIRRIKLALSTSHKVNLKALDFQFIKAKFPSKEKHFGKLVGSVTR